MGYLILLGVLSSHRKKIKKGLINLVDMPIKLFWSDAIESPLSKISQSVLWLIE